MTAKKLETVAEAARDTGIPPSRLYELVAKAKREPDDPGRIPFIQIESRIYFRAGALDDWFRWLEADSVGRGRGDGGPDFAARAR